MAAVQPQLFRVGGSAYTVFQYNSKPLIYCDTFREISQRPVANPEPVQPMDSQYPMEIAFPAALQAGTLEVQFREQWNTEVWELIPGYAGAQDLLGVFQRNLTIGKVTCTKLIQGPNNQYRAVYYHGCVIVNVAYDETINVGTMTLPKGITMMYTQRTMISGTYSG